MGLGIVRYAAVVTAAILGSQSANAAGAPEAVSCKLIRNVNQLQAINNNQAGNYCLANDIDASSVGNFMPLGFTGRFFGNGYTIRNLTIDSPFIYVGLFHATAGALIQDLRLINVKVTGSADGAFVGGLIGRMQGGSVSRVHVDGEVTCTTDCIAGGIVGVAHSGDTLITESSSSARVSGPTSGDQGYAGGAIGVMNSTGSVATRIYATGPVSCGADTCEAGGLVGTSVGLIDLSTATGPVSTAAAGHAGGLVGRVLNATGIVRRSAAFGAVDGGTAANAGGLIGTLSDATAEQSYAVGPVSGAGNVGGFLGDAPGDNTMTALYWDKQTSKQAMDLGNTTGRSTAQMRNALPAGFDSNWDITSGLSYPFMNDAQIDFTPPLATLAFKNRVYTFLPISQSEPSEYLTPPEHADDAALATVYTMVARAIGLTRNIASLTFAGIDKYFWDDATQTTTWAGPVTQRATLGAFTAIPPATDLDDSNVIGALTAQQLVVLRGIYKKSDGTNGTHWMLATLYTKSGASVDAIVANDPYTGAQVMIDPQTKRVVSPSKFPLTGFRVNGYRTITLL